MLYIVGSWQGSKTSCSDCMAVLFWKKASAELFPIEIKEFASQEIVQLHQASESHFRSRMGPVIATSLKNCSI